MACMARKAGTAVGAGPSDAALKLKRQVKDTGIQRVKMLTCGPSPLMRLIPGSTGLPSRLSSGSHPPTERA